MDFGAVLRDLRKDFNMTQADLARALSVAESAVSMWELGRRRPDYVKLEEIADYFNVDMNYLLGKTNVRNSYQESLSRRPITDDDLCFALFGDAENITDADLQKVKDFAAFIKSGKG